MELKAADEAANLIKKDRLDLSAPGPAGNNFHADQLRKLYGFPLNGIQKTYYHTGVLASEGNYVNSKAQGRIRWYHENGKLKMEGDFRAGIPEGGLRLYYSNGEPQAEYQIEKAGEIPLDGEINLDAVVIDAAIKDYYGTGILKQERAVKNGLLSGPFKYYDQKGKLLAAGEYLDGKLTGTLTSYEESGAKRYVYTLTREAELQIQTNTDFSNLALEGTLREYDAAGNLVSEKSYQNGKTEGPFKLYASDGKLKAEGVYKSGVYAGAVKLYDEEGKLLYELTPEKAGILPLEQSGDVTRILSDGLVRIYAPGGNLLLEGALKDKKLTGVAKTYFENGKPRYLLEIKTADAIPLNRESLPAEGDIEEGSIIKYYESGNIEKEYNVLHKIPNGTYREYFESGATKAEASYINDLKDGVEKEYYPDGSIKSEAFYLKGVISGRKRDYYENGALKEERNYREGKLNGQAAAWHENGKKKYEREYREDIPDGRAVTYYEDGEVQEEANYAGGVYDGAVVRYLKTGDLAEEIHYKNGVLHGTHVKYNEEGGPVFERNYVEGLPEGEFKNYYPNGKLSESVSYKNGAAVVAIDETRNGTYIFYYDAGKTKKLAEEPWRKGKKSGNFKEYYDNGKLFSETTWYDNVKDGEQNFYDRQGKLLLKKFYMDKGATALVEQYNDDRTVTRWIETYDLASEMVTGDGKTPVQYETLKFDERAIRIIQARKDAEAKAAEAARIAAEKLAEEKRLEAERVAEAKRQEEERAEAAKKAAEEQRIAEEKTLEREARAKQERAVLIEIVQRRLAAFRVNPGKLLPAAVFRLYSRETGDYDARNEKRFDYRVSISDARTDLNSVLTIMQNNTFSIPNVIIGKSLVSSKGNNNDRFHFENDQRELNQISIEITYYVSSADKRMIAIRWNQLVIDIDLEKFQHTFARGRNKVPDLYALSTEELYEYAIPIIIVSEFFKNLFDPGLSGFVKQEQPKRY